MRRLLVDENLSPDLADVLSKVHTRDVFCSAQRANLLGVDDKDLFADMAARGYDALITLDRHQLEDNSERTLLREHRLHWIGVPQILEVSGVGLFALHCATVLTGVHHVLGLWAQTPTAYTLRGPGHLGLAAPESCEL